MLSSFFYFGAFLNSLFYFKEPKVVYADVFDKFKLKHLIFMRNLGLIILFLLAFSMWFVYSQIYFLLPFYISKTLNYVSLINYLLSFNAIALIALQGVVTFFITKYFMHSHMLAIALGFAFIGGGYIMFQQQNSVIWLWVGFFLLSLGELIILPELDFLVSEVVGKFSTTYVFSVYTIFCGVGYGLSNLIFGKLIEHNIYIALELLAYVSIVLCFFSILLFVKTKYFSKFIKS
ncbi:MFS transporter [Acerihabitans sp. KWT182]|uniref:MFS transporter n=1 Tax=Acerihabitans sp. KWT182 TaxID=3157919 RepID=A0AAU7Q7U6_9GAMM